jgi:hypothetical protein
MEIFKQKRRVIKNIIFGIGFANILYVKKIYKPYDRKETITMKKLLLVIMSIICALALAGPAMALTLDNSDLFGSVDPGSPADVGDVAPRLQQGIDLYNFWNPLPFTGTISGYLYTVIYGADVPDSPDLPDVNVASGVKIDTSSLTNTINDPYLYLVAKYDDKDFLYYLGGATGSITLVDPIQQGISNFVLFNSTPGNGNGNGVPEPATMLLLGSGLVGLWALRRKFKK